MAKPPVRLSLNWTGGLAFQCDGASGRTITTDGDGASAMSPVELLGAATASCMAVDVVHILTKARQPPVAVSVEFTGYRAEEEPRRLLRIELAFRVEGAATRAQVDRALQLSRDKYCSVWNSLREDITLEIVTRIDASAAR